MGRAGRAAFRATQPRCSTGSRLGWCSWRRSPAASATAGRADVGRADAWTDTARRADLGGATAAAAFDAAAPAAQACRTSTGSTSRSAQLGRHRRAARAGLGRSTASRASRAGAATPRPGGCAATPRRGGCAATAATCRCAAIARTDVGVASGRGSPGCGFVGSLVGRRATGRAGAKHVLDRLGIARRQRSAGGAAGAVMERARRGIVMGRAQERGAGSPGGPVMGRSGECTRRGSGLVGACPG